MKKLLIVICWLLLLTILSYAQGNIRLIIGPTFSYFMNAENTHPKIGISVGIMKDFRLYNKFLLSAGIGFSSRGSILENRTIEPYAPEPFEETYYYDIHGMIGYLEFPVTIQYAISISQKIKLRPLFGAAVSFAIKDFSHFEEKQLFRVYDPTQSDLSDYDFDFEQESRFLGIIPKLPLTFGFRVDYEKLGFEIRYILDNRDTYHFGRLSEVHHKMHSFYFLVCF